MVAAVSSVSDNTITCVGFETDDWQSPAITELLQHQIVLASASMVQASPTRPICYVGLPWATFIDRKEIPQAAQAMLWRQVGDWRRQIAQRAKLDAPEACHTVCQHIYWQRLLPLWREIGLTDLHLSHLEQDVHLEDIRVHSWHLAAANVVNEDRREGLVFGRNPAEKRWLASFIGAHMHHYRSDVRLRLRDEAARDGFHDIFYELKEDWHFNLLVYQEQVERRPLDSIQRAAERQANIRYNEVLSDSVFALCPEGAGPNTIRLWEALAVGSVPVVTAENWVWPTIPGGDLTWSDAVIHVGREEIGGLFDRLRWMRRFEPLRVAAMQKAAMEIYRRFEIKRCF